MFRSKYLVKINYKSGTSMEFWVYEFSMSGGEYSWIAAENSNPILMGVDEIESVWQLRSKRFGFI